MVDQLETAFRNGIKANSPFCMNLKPTFYMVWKFLFKMDGKLSCIRMQST